MSDNELPEDALYGCLPEWPKFGNPETPNKVQPDISFLRKVHTSGDLMMPDGKKIRFWGFEDDRSGRTWPSPLMRMRQDQIVHVTLKSSTNVHTIHHHGIEPDAQNDGAGHTSFEVSGSYTYQFQPHQAGTFFYHCHVNTVLHVQMGMFGPLIVDPPDGPGKAFVGGPTYDVEAIWAPTGIDPRWHTLSHHDGVCGDDVGLNDFNPKYFLINGAPHPKSLTAKDVAVTARVGQTILVRYINAGYFPQRVTFGGLEAEVVASDGHPFRDANRQFTSFKKKAQDSSAAERYDFLLRPTKTGVYTAEVKFFHWIHGNQIGVARTRITVT
ncbi:MAG: multicopper oxidase domain-containing protein [Chloroflexia bacterium]|nr:multicopper oxidase domain-containing protein [Chloroflexia bacterium]